MDKKTIIKKGIFNLLMLLAYLFQAIIGIICVFNSNLIFVILGVLLFCSACGGFEKTSKKLDVLKNEVDDTLNKENNND